MNSSPTDAQQQGEPPMRLAVLGATGSVGRELVTQALAAGHEVTALVRERPKPGEIDDRVALVLGDAASADAVERTVVGSDAVVSALGHAKGAPDDILARATANVIAAMRADSSRQARRAVVAGRGRHGRPTRASSTVRAPRHAHRDRERRA